MILVQSDGAWLWHPVHCPQGLQAARPEEAGDLAHILLSRPNSRVTLVTDDAAQEILLDHIPLLRGLDRRQLIVRRVRQHYPDADFAACIAGQRQESQERISILHLPNDMTGAAWLHWLKALPNPPGGTIASTKIAAHIFERLSGDDPAEWTHGFIVTKTGLRHVALQHGHPVLTRLLPLPEETESETLPAALAAAMRQEVQAAHHFLARYGWREENSEHVVGIAPPEWLEGMRGGLPSSVLLLTPAEAGRWLRCGQETADWRLLYAVAAQKFRRALYPLFLPREREALRHGQIAALGRMAAAFLLLAGGGLTFYRGWEYYGAQQSLRMARNDQDSLNKIMTENRAAMGDVAKARARLRQARILKQDMAAPAPWPVLLALEQSMEPQLRLNELQWNATGKQGVIVTMKLRLISTQDDKDALQREALQVYDDFTKNLRRTLPHARLQTHRAPFALAPEERFSDPAMLQTAAVREVSAELEMRLP